MKDIKVVATDMDHTLLTEKGELPPGFYDYVDKLNELGVYFGIASGRPLCTLQDVFKDYSDRMLLVSDNGGLVWLDKQIAFVSLMDKNTYQDLIRFTKKHTEGICVLCGLDGGYIEKKDEQHKDFINKFFTHMTIVDDLSELDIKANKFTIYCPEANAIDYLEEFYVPRYQEELSLTLGDTIWIDIMNKGISKGSAMRFIADKLGITTNQMMAFGDTYNDAEMLKAVKYSYVVENASEDMRQYANYIAKSNDEYGVLRVLDELIDSIENNK